MVSDIDNPISGNQTNGQVKDLVEVKNLVKYFPVRGGVLKRVVA
jgi:hypothetical protein